MSKGFLRKNFLYNGIFYQMLYVLRSPLTLPFHRKRSVFTYYIDLN